jgi:hypothetical protein
VAVSDVRVVSDAGVAGRAFIRDVPLRIQLHFSLASEAPGMDVSVFVTNQNGVRIFDESLSDHGPVRLGAGSYCAELSIPAVLNVGDYTVGMWFGTTHEDFVHELAATSFTLSGSGHANRLLALGLPFVVRPVAGTS